MESLGGSISLEASAYALAAFLMAERLCFYSITVLVLLELPETLTV